VETPPVRCRSLGRTGPPTGVESFSHLHTRTPAVNHTGRPGCGFRAVPSTYPADSASYVLQASHTPCLQGLGSVSRNRFRGLDEEDAVTADLRFGPPPPS